MDDILRDEIRRNMTLNDQKTSIKISANIVIIMFIGGLINSILSFLTFQNKDVRNVGCGMYLLASSITSLLTICMLTVKFWFVLLTQMDLLIHRSIIRGGCVYIESILKIFLYFDGWLNACVALERAMLVFRGVNFNKMKSKKIARWMISILPICIIGSIIHEPFHRQLIEDKEHTWCITRRYSPVVQYYNTIILFFHLIGPFIGNLFSALFIIFESTRRRSRLQTRQTYRQHLNEQFHEHRQLLISPIILLILSLPRLVMSLLSQCINATNYPWLFLVGYFISFIPSMLIFLIFVFPSKSYREAFQQKTCESL